MPGSGQARTVRVPWASSAVPGIRRTIVADLVVRGVSAEIIDEAEIVVSELVANAAPPRPRPARRHGPGALEGQERRGRGRGVRRRRPHRAAPRTPLAWAAAGRGLRIVRSLAHEWGVQEDRGGRTVWAALGGPVPAAQHLTGRSLAAHRRLARHAPAAPCRRAPGAPAARVRRPWPDV